MAEIPLKYEKRGIAYLDIVGFTSKVEDVRQDPARLRQVAEAMESLETVLSATSTGRLTAHMFSDTIVITFPDLSRMPAYGLSYLSVFQVYSAVRGFFLRGGIAQGDHYEKGGVMFGPAYLDAYELERLAVWPRVLVHPNVLTLDPGAFDWADRTIRDDFGMTFVDYLHNAFTTFVAYEWIAEYTKSGDVMLVSSNDLFPRHREAILKAIEGVVDLSVLSKYHALGAYHNSVIRRLVSTLRGWLSAPKPADSMKLGSQTRHLVDLFLAGADAKMEKENSHVVDYLAAKLAGLPEEHGRLEDGIIDLPRAFPTLYPTTQKG